MRIKKTEVWSGIGKKQGIRIANLNINGRRDDKRETNSQN